MLQRFVIEEFLKELCVKLDEEGWVNLDGQDFLFDEMAKDGAVIQFVQDWLKEHKGEL